MPYTRAYSFILRMYTFLPLARLFFVWRDFSLSGATFFCLARLFFSGATFFYLARLFSVGTLSKVINLYRNANLNFVHDNYRRIHADVIVYMFSHLHTALRIEGNMLDIN